LPIDSNDEIVQNPEGGISFIRREGDNRSDGTGVPSSGIFEASNSTDHQVTVNLNEKGYGMAEAIVILSRQPGNNFKVAGAFDEGVRNGLHLKAGTQEQALRVWTSDNKRVPEGNEPDILPVARATELLTVWRRLWVEADSMAPPSSFPKEPHFDDDLSRDVPDPDISIFSRAMKEAYVEVKDIKEVVGAWVNPNTPFYHCFASRLYPELCVNTRRDGVVHYARSHRQSPSEPDFWAVYVINVYELFPHELEFIMRGRIEDNDPEEEFAFAAFTNIAVPQVSICGIEILRDLATQWGFDLKRLIGIAVAHELGHQFDLGERSTTDNLMWAPSPDTDGDNVVDEGDEPKFAQVQTRWHPEDIRQIRSIRYPGEEGGN
jgi:hypothetical protein